MTDSNDSNSSGFSEQKQEVYADIPTEPEAFLRWAASRPRSEGKYELSRGRVQHTMINVTRRHATIVTNITFKILRQIDRDRFFVAATDFAVRTLDGIRGPDILVDAAVPEGDALSTATPVFLAEFLSPSSTGRDFTEKRQEYLALNSLQTYVICSQDEPRAWIWSRNQDGSWPDNPKELAGRSPSIPLGGLDIEISMAAISRGIPDAPA